VELRQLEAFVVLADELHFGHAATRLHLGQPTLSDLIRRLERELGTPLFVRTTRRVTLTEAGQVLLGHSRTVLAGVAEARAAVAGVGAGETGLVRVGFTPPVAPVLAPHLVAGFEAAAPGVRLEQAQLWLPSLQHALAERTVDVALTCGVFGATVDTETEVFAAEPLLVGLRPEHRLARSTSVELQDVCAETLGMTDPSLFPAWTSGQRHALEVAGVAPPTVQLTRTDLNAADWLDQPEVGWVLLTSSLTRGHAGDVILPVRPALHLEFVVQWRSTPVPSPAVARFVRHVLEMPLPPGWVRARRRL
jgi:DNA-binding transcriptional LysR family regulator